LNVTFNFTPASEPGPPGDSEGQRTGMEWTGMGVGRVAKAERSRSERSDPRECRCLCGSLVARRVHNGVELKCRRCKRTVVLPLELTGPAPEIRAPEATP
jgi:hypothetical protein